MELQLVRLVITIRSFAQDRCDPGIAGRLAQVQRGVVVPVHEQIEVNPAGHLQFGLITVAIVHLYGADGDGETVRLFETHSSRIDPVQSAIECNWRNAVTAHTYVQVHDHEAVVVLAGVVVAVVGVQGGAHFQGHMHIQGHARIGAARVVGHHDPVLHAVALPQAGGTGPTERGAVAHERMYAAVGRPGVGPFQHLLRVHTTGGGDHDRRHEHTDRELALHGCARLSIRV